MPSSIRIRRLVPGATSSRGLIDTSVAIDLETVDVSRLPEEIAISALTLAELACGPFATEKALDRAQRQGHLQRIEATFECLDFDPMCARAFGPIYAATLAIGRKARGSRSVDLMIAASARAHRLPLYTLNAVDFAGLDDLVEIVDLAGDA